MKIKMKHPLTKSILLGIISTSVCLLFTFFFQVQRNHEEKLEMDRIYQNLQSEAYETLQVQMAKLQVMEGHLIETGGDFRNFSPIAERMLNDSSVRSFLFAPDGVVKGVFPMEGNEPVYGLNMNLVGAGNLEARNAMETGSLILAGPFELVEGGLGVCGRMPIYLDDEEGHKTYWGLVTVTLNYPDIFQNIVMDDIYRQGYSCKVWRLNPDDSSFQVILSTPATAKVSKQTLYKKVDFFHTDWYFTISPLILWYQRKSLWLSLFLSLCAGSLVFYGSYNSMKIKQMKEETANSHIKNLQEKLEQEEAKQLLNQIRSHFFYHTLNTLQGLILLNPDMAVKMVEDFARYLRFNVNTSVNAEELISFKDEIRATKAYAQINEAQLGERLHVDFQIPNVNFKIPALTIEPIVENAILHGIKPKVGGGTVSVTLKEDPDFWRIHIEDDGIGFDVNAQTKAHAIGLSNVRKRFSHFEGCGMDLHSVPGEGTKVHLYFSKKGLKPKHH